jgi:hypothetical protein
MKKLALILLVALSSILSFSASAQTCNYDPISMRNQRYDDSCNMVSWFQANTTFSPLLQTLKEVTTAHAYTVAGKPIIYNGSTNKDTITLNNSAYSAGYRFTIINTNSGNDTTYLIPTSGRFDSVSVKVWGTAPYRAREIYFDGTNYWSISQQ